MGGFCYLSLLFGGVFIYYCKHTDFHAIVQANQFLDKNGNDMFTSDGKIAGEYIDARGITIKDAQGNDVVYFDETGIHWNKDYSPIKYQFSTSLNGPWHDTYAANDEYRRESFDGGTTWEAPYKLVGKDGRPGADGSDANVPGYIKSTYIDMTSVEAPYIKANLLTVQTPDSSMESGLLLTGYYRHDPYDWLKISYGEGDFPEVSISSPDHANINIGYGANATRFYGTVSFAGANISWGDNHPTAVLA